jgi:hypothetical protein
LNTSWVTPIGTLGVSARVGVADIATMDAAFAETRNGRPIPLGYLSREHLA